MFCPFRKKKQWEATKYKGIQHIGTIVTESEEYESFLPCIEEKCMAFQRTSEDVCKLIDKH